MILFKRTAGALALCFFMMLFAIPSQGAENAWDKQTSRDTLIHMNLLQAGAGKLDLSAHPTRLEAGIMLLRVLGLEQEALANPISHPFSDVPQWAKNQVGFLYAKGLSSGVGNQKFGSSVTTTAEQYCTFILKALGYSDFTVNTAVDRAITAGLLPSAMRKELVDFDRGDMYVLTVHALGASINGLDKTLLQQMQERLATPAQPGTPDASRVQNNDTLASYRMIPYYRESRSDRYLAYEKKFPAYTLETIVTYVNIGLDQPFYSNIREIKDPDSLTVLVNKYNKLPDTYKPKLAEVNAAFITKGKGKLLLRAPAREAYEKMARDGNKLGLKITCYSTYRSIATQNAIWNREVNKGRTVEDVDSLNARGGHSEHNTGLAVDLTDNTSKEFAWCKDNAAKYGFILRYPYGKTNITGYTYEPWHFRYVGIDLARAVVQSGLTYDEYYVRYLAAPED